MIGAEGWSETERSPVDDVEAQRPAGDGINDARRLDAATDSEPVEIVERKGIGHPDSICDALAETLSRNLCRYYLDRFGEILHHNVDKALLCGGSAAPRFGGGEVVAPVEIYLSGRATEIVGET